MGRVGSCFIPSGIGDKRRTFLGYSLLKYAFALHGGVRYSIRHIWGCRIRQDMNK